MGKKWYVACAWDGSDILEAGRGDRENGVGLLEEVAGAERKTNEAKRREEGRGIIMEFHVLI